jgi:putative addiction module killer protein
MAWKSWDIQYWDRDEEWLEKRTPQQIKAIAKEIKLLERAGNMLRLPHSKSLGLGLFELRERAYGYRIYYTFLPGRNIVLLQMGDKSTQQQDIKIARNRLVKIQPVEA